MLNQVKHTLYRLTRRPATALLLFIFTVLPCTTYAEHDRQLNVSILNSHEGGYYSTFISRFRQTATVLAQKSQIDIRFDEKLVTDQFTPGPGDTLYVTVGSRAAISMLQSGATNPVLHTLLPEQTYTRISAMYPPRGDWHGRVFIDFHATSFLDLIKTSLPEKTRIGTILGPDSRQHAGALSARARNLGLELAIEYIEDENDIVTALKALQGRMQVFLALPDKQVHNRRTAKTILLSTYRYNIPVVAYSQAYVKAGALIGMYARPEDLADQAAEKLFRHINTKADVDCSNQPEVISIDINDSVSRLLARNIPAATYIERVMRENIARCAE